MYSKSCIVSSVKEARQQHIDLTLPWEHTLHMQLCFSTSKDHSYMLPIYGSRQSCHQVVPDFFNWGEECDGSRWLSFRTKLADASILRWICDFFHGNCAFCHKSVKLRWISKEQIKLWRHFEIIMWGLWQPFFKMAAIEIPKCRCSAMVSYIKRR